MSGSTNKNRSVTWIFVAALLVGALLGAASTAYICPTSSHPKPDAPAAGVAPTDLPSAGVAAAHREEETAQLGCLAEGAISIRELLRYLGSATGKLISHAKDPENSWPFAPHVSIPILADLDPCSPKQVIDLLEANGYRVEEVQLPHGPHALFIQYVGLRIRASITATGPPELLVPDERTSDRLDDLAEGIERRRAQESIANVQIKVPVWQLLAVLRAHEMVASQKVIAALQVENSTIEIRGRWRRSSRTVLLKVLELAGYASAPFLAKDGSRGIALRALPSGRVFGEDEVVLIRPLIHTRGADVIETMQLRRAAELSSGAGSCLLEAVDDSTIVAVASDRVVRMVEAELMAIDRP